MKNIHSYIIGSNLSTHSSRHGKVGLFGTCYEKTNHCDK